MRLALPGSALVHGTIMVVLLAGFTWPEPEDAPAGTPVTVDIVSLSAVTDNVTETIESDATESLVSAGTSATVSTVSAPTVEPVDPAAPQPVSELLEPIETPTPQNPQSPPTVKPLTQQSAGVEVAELSSAAPSLEALAAQPVAAPIVQPVTPATQTLEPTEVQDLKTAPVPQTLTIARRSEPTYPRPSATSPTPKPQAEHRPQPPAASASAGNGGASNADSTAGRSGGQQGQGGSGGDAAVAEYPGKVLGRLRNALRYPRDAGGAAGEVHVQFTVSANGVPTGLQVVRSSGNAAIDQAGIATVSRAAPFPPIPAGAGRSNWIFTVPLAFQR